MYVAYNNIGSKRFYLSNDGEMTPFIDKAKRYDKNETEIYKGIRRVKRTAIFQAKTMKVACS